MNEKIKELIEQTEINFDKDINEVEVCVMLPSDLERFAELIVKECILYIDGRDYSSGSEGIAEHFGFKL